MTRPHPLPEGLRGRGFTPRELDDTGVWRGRARAKDIERPYHGVYTDRPPRSVLDHCHIYAARLRPGQAFSHQTAALLHGLPLPSRLAAATPLHVVAVRPQSPPRTEGVVGHRLPVAPILQPVEGLSVCAGTEAWAQLADALTLDELIEVADHLLTVSPFPPDRTRRLLETRIAAFRRPGAAKLRGALAEARCPVRSPGETRVRLLLVRAGIPEPEVNGRVLTADGRYLGKPDLLWRVQRVGLEYEGAGHTEEEQVLFDVERREAFEDHGWHIVRATKHDLRGEQRRQALVDRVRARLMARS